MKPEEGIPAGTLVVVARGRRAEQLGITYTHCYGPGRWPFVGAGWGSAGRCDRPRRASCASRPTRTAVRFGLPPGALPSVVAPESPRGWRASYNENRVTTMSQLSALR